MFWACFIPLDCAAHAAEVVSRVLRINLLNSLQPQRCRPARTHRLYKYTASTLGPFQSSPQHRRAACYIPRAAEWRARQLSSLRQRHRHGLLRRLLVVAAECVHTACRARAANLAGIIPTADTWVGRWKSWHD